MTYEEFKAQIKPMMTIKQFCKVLDLHTNTPAKWRTKNEVPIWVEYALQALKKRDMDAVATDNELFAAMRAAVAEHKKGLAKALLARLLVTELRESAQTYYVNAFGDDFWLAKVDAQEAYICPGYGDPAVGQGLAKKYWTLIPDAILTHGAPFETLKVRCTNSIYQILPGADSWWTFPNTTTRGATATLQFWEMSKFKQIAIIEEGLIPWLNKYSLEIV